jgi:cytochrome c551/c552
MFKFRKSIFAAALLALAGLSSVHAASKYADIGRPATPKEVAAWDIDVRPDFKGLPAGSGTVAQGQDIWEGKCASCHGFFGESGEVFNPIIGGVQPEDLKTGHVKNLVNPDFPGRTTIMKVASVSTLWDYINRAMPWNAPKTLKTDEVYAVLAFLLNLGGVVPDDFTLNEKTIRDVQAKMPNRNGMTTDHALWPGNEFKGAKKPDTANKDCMKDCATEPKIASFLPDFARDAHGNLAEQNRIVGAQKGADTTKPELKPGEKPAAPAAAPKKAEPVSAGKVAAGLMQKNGCLVCHGMTNKVVGPAFSDVAKKYPGKVDYLAGKIKNGGAGVWGPIPMPPQALSEADAKTIAAWLADGAK